MKGIKELLEKIKADKDFAEKYAALDNAEAVAEQAKADGYDVTKKDVENAVKCTTCEGSCTGKTELTEEQLESAAGGNSFGWTQNRWDATECSKINRDTFPYSEGRRCKGGGLPTIPCDHYIRTDVGYIYRRNGFGEVVGSDPAWNHKCGYGKYNFSGYSNGDPLLDGEWIAK